MRRNPAPLQVLRLVAHNFGRVKLMNIGGAITLLFCQAYYMLNAIFELIDVL
jgi:hypothetical protein